MLQVQPVHRWTSRAIGLDLHRDFCEVAICEDGVVRSAGRVRMAPEGLEALAAERPRLAALRRRAREGALTLVYSAQDTEHNDAVVLAEVLRRGLPKARR